MEFKKENLIGKKVLHKTFGAGIIKTFDNDYVYIEFNNCTVKKFQFPKAFEGFLKAVDEDAQRWIGSIIEPEPIPTPPPTPRPDPLPNPRPAPQGLEGMVWTPVYTYKEVEEKFGIVRRGFGRGINVTSNSVVLISNVQKQHGQFVYHDKWEEGRYVYSGEGQTGNQIMSAGNMAILNADRDGRVIHLLIKFSSKEYIYQGIFGLVKHYFKDEADANGRIRKEIKFVLERKSFGD